jgi:hypothetical protein
MLALYGEGQNCRALSTRCAPSIGCRRPTTAAAKARQNSHRLSGPGPAALRARGAAEGITGVPSPTQRGPRPRQRRHPSRGTGHSDCGRHLAAASQLRQQSSQTPCEPRSPDPPPKNGCSGSPTRLSPTEKTGSGSRSRPASCETHSSASSPRRRVSSMPRRPPAIAAPLHLGLGEAEH